MLLTVDITDIFLLVIIVAAVLVGFFWGAARSTLLLAAWLGAFLAGAYLRLQLGTYLAGQWTDYDATFNQTAAFGIIFMGLLLLAPVVIVIGTPEDQQLSRHQVLDDAVGAVFAGFVAVLGIAGLMIVLATYYDERMVAEVSAPEWVSTLYLSLMSSGIGSAIDARLIPLLGLLLGPLLPADVREVMA